MFGSDPLSAQFGTGNRFYINDPQAAKGWMLPLYQAAWLGCGNVDATAVPPSVALRHRCSRNRRFRCVGGCRDDRIKVLMNWPPDFGSDVEIPLSTARDGVGDGPDIVVRSANCRLETELSLARKMSLRLLQYRLRQNF
jgi:hypothetical protein